MQGKLTTHVLDTASGKPAGGMRVQLFWLELTGDVLLKPTVTNADGRTETPLLDTGRLSAGVYKLVFQVGEYFESVGHADARRFLDAVPIVFTVDDAAANYHVPLLVSPWSYSTYRGS